MSLIDIRRVFTQVEDIHHEGGPRAAQPLRRGAIAAVLTNPYAGRYEPDILPMMEALNPVGLDMARRLQAGALTPSELRRQARVGVAELRRFLQACLALQLLQHRLQRLGWAGLDHRADLIGVDAMHGPGLGADRAPYEVRVRLAVRCATHAQAERVGQEVEALYLNGPAAGGGVTQSVREVIAVASALVPLDAAPQAVTVMELCDEAA